MKVIQILLDQFGYGNKLHILQATHFIN